MGTTFTNRQLSFAILGALVGYGIMRLPNHLAQTSGTGSWLSILVGTATAIFFTLGITYLNHVHCEKTLGEYSAMLVGKGWSKVFMSVYVLYFFIFLAMILRLSSEVIQQTVLYETPYWAIMLALISLVAYTLLKGIKTIIKICVLLGILTLFVAVVAHSLVYTQGDWLNVLPLLPAKPASDYLMGAIHTVLPLLGIEILLVIPFGKKNGKKVFWYTSLTVLFIGLFYIFVVYSCLAVMGEGSLIYYSDAILSTIRHIKIEQLEFFKRLDGIVLIGWVFSVYTSLSLFGYGAATLVNGLIPKPKPNSYNITVLSVCLLSFIGALIPESFAIADKVFEYATFIAVLTVFLIPLILIIATKAKGYGKKNENA